MSPLPEVTGPALSLLRLAAEQDNFEVAHSGALETARGLCDIGYLDEGHDGSFSITSAGRIYLDHVLAQGHNLKFRPKQEKRVKGLRPAPRPRPLVPSIGAPLPLSDLSASQRDILYFIHDYLKQNGVTPTNREIMESVGLRSTSTISYNVDRLITAGYLKRVSRSARGLRVARELPSKLLSLKIELQESGDREADLAAAQNAIKDIEAYMARLQAQ